MLPLRKSQFLRVQLPLQVRHLPLQLLRLLLLLPARLRPLHLSLHLRHLPIQLPLHLRQLPRERLDRLHVLLLHHLLLLLVRPDRVFQLFQCGLFFLLVVGQLLLQAFDLPEIDKLLCVRQFRWNFVFMFLLVYFYFSVRKNGRFKKFNSL